MDNFGFLRIATSLGWMWTWRHLMCWNKLLHFLLTIWIRCSPSTYPQVYSNTIFCFLLVSSLFAIIIWSHRVYIKHSFQSAITSRSSSYSCFLLLHTIFGNVAVGTSTAQTIEYVLQSVQYSIWDKYELRRQSRCRTIVLHREGTGIIGS